MSINTPSVLLILHLQTPIDITTVSNIAKSMMVEQKSPLLTTSKASPLCRILHISQGNGSLSNLKKENYMSIESDCIDHTALGNL
jgi:hypothetical protein